MRFLVNVRFPNREFNAAVKDGTAGAKIDKILAAIKPEAAYFTSHHGQRGAVLIVEIPDASKIPALAEPFFLTFAADVECHIVMLPEDLKKAGIEKLGKLWG
jgi:hypothetical protein